MNILICYKTGEGVFWELPVGNLLQNPPKSDSAKKLGELLKKIADPHCDVSYCGDTAAQIAYLIAVLLKDVLPELPRYTDRPMIMIPSALAVALQLVTTPKAVAVLIDDFLQRFGPIA